jgi:two-component system heavy metal sensor histidine kinase CusS
VIPVKSLSITVRLALLFAGVAIVTFAAVGTYLYQALAQQLERRDDAELIGKITLIRHLLLEVPSINAIEQNPHPFLDAVFGHDGVVLRLVAPDGRIVVQNTEPSRPLPPVDMVAAGRELGEADVRNWRPAAGTGRLVAAIGPVGGPAQTPVGIVVAREESDRTALLREYGRNLFLAVCLGAVLAAALGFIIVRVGMRPLRSVIGKANDISTHRLNTRLSVRNAPTELRELGAAFNAMLDRLEDGVQRLSRFAADLAHDLRTPINTLMVETQVALSRPRGTDEYQMLLVSNIEEYERLARMIENTLFLARADNTQLALHRETLNAKTELERIRDYFEGLAEEAGVALTVDAQNAAVSADPILFQRAVSNLVSNAIQHTPRGGLVRLSANQCPHCLEIAVKNSGAGIPPEHLPHIFDRYYRADAARSASSQSAGLGLAIVRAIMHLHGGEVTVQSVIGESATFFLRFGAQRL